MYVEWDTSSPALVRLRPGTPVVVMGFETTTMAVGAEGPGPSRPVQLCWALLWGPREGGGWGPVHTGMAGLRMAARRAP